MLSRVSLFRFYFLPIKLESKSISFSTVIHSCYANRLLAYLQSANSDGPGFNLAIHIQVSKFFCLFFPMNSKCLNQTTRMCSLVCAFIVSTSTTDLGPVLLRNTRVQI